MNFYKEDLLDHYHHPRNQGCLAHCTHQSLMANPSCGDKIQFFMNVLDAKIEQIGFVVSGCVLSTAAASKLSEVVKKKDVSFVSSLNNDSMRALMGIEIGINRMQCIILPLQALQNALLKRT